MCEATHDPENAILIFFKTVITVGMMHDYKNYPVPTVRNTISRCTVSTHLQSLSVGSVLNPNILWNWHFFSAGYGINPERPCLRVI